MKHIAKYIALGLGAAALAACEDIDTKPAGDIITEEQKAAIVEDQPDRLEADVIGLYAGMNVYGTVSTSSTEYHFDFGYPCVAIMTGGNGMDEPSPNTNYNWFSPDMDFSDRLYQGSRAAFMWRLFYNDIKAANDIIGLISPDTENATLKSYRGQSLATRAFCYLNLVQLYQFTYATSKDKPAVPIVTEGMNAEEAASNPRASVAAVYELIFKDLDEAIALLDGYQRANKGLIDQHVAYGLRARANLLTENWEAAASDAVKARQGYAPLSIEGAGVPGFNDIGLANWIWGIDIVETNDVVQTGIVNWPSWLCNFTGSGYCTLVGVWRKINSDLWADIPATDVRKGWWVDEDITSPLIDDMIVEGYSAAEYFEYEPYANLKFGAYKDEPGNATNAQDWVLMRSEEMILIEVEALAMAGHTSQAKDALEDFVRTYRDPSYTCTATSAAALRDEVWFQRRIELWGEGFSFQDCLRLQKDIKRSGVKSFPEDCAIDYRANDPILLWRIPQEEIEANDGISEADNNN